MKRLTDCERFLINSPGYSNSSIPGDGFTELKIYNSLGQEVKTLVSDYLAKGKYTFEWNAASYSSGIYYYFLKSGNNVTTSKIILLK